MKKKIHINQHIIRSNKKNGTEEPVITIKTSKSNTYANEVEIFGKSKLIYSPNKPLPCGARVWIETDEKIVLDNGITIESIKNLSTLNLNGRLSTISDTIILIRKSYLASRLFYQQRNPRRKQPL
jgi:hypothetical protein